MKYRINPIFYRLACGAVVFLCVTHTLMGQSINQRYVDYIEKYKDMAIDQMTRYKIPASITLSQGILESGAGRSTLATEANNHFGIKCGSTWNGPDVVRDDDARNEKFRKYRNAAESYEDHSRFLQQPRYRRLYDLKITDYKGWAHGLKRCGYATNPRYASLLINIIELYQLDRFDTGKHRTAKYDYDEIDKQLNSESLPVHLVYKNNENYYILANAGDTFASLAEETGVSARDIRRYNELPKGYQLQTGDVIYLQRKRKHAAKKYKHVPHVVQAGESLYTISQRYGIRLESLYKMNDLPADHAVQVNDRLKVR